jgi:hypothetical protein
MRFGVPPSKKGAWPDAVIAMRVSLFHYKELSRRQTIKDRQFSCSYSISLLGLSEETLG